MTNALASAGRGYPPRRDGFHGLARLEVGLSAKVAVAIPSTGVAAVLSFMLALGVMMLSSSSAQEMGGELSVADFKLRMRERIMQNDRDGDGRLSKIEFETGRSGQSNGTKPNAAMFLRLDGNGDGYLSAEEIEQILSARAARVDADKNGRISRSEADAARAARSGNN